MCIYVGQGLALPALGPSQVLAKKMAPLRNERQGSQPLLVGDDPVSGLLYRGSMGKSNCYCLLVW